AEPTQMAESWSAALRKRRRAANERDAADWQRLRNREDWESIRDQRVDRLRRSLGMEAPVPPDLKLVTTGTVAGTGYRIENVVFESRPGLLVTANLYAPSAPR